MKKTIILTGAMMMTALTATAQSVDVKSFRYAGPYTVNAPVMMDSVNVNQKKFDEQDLLNSSINLNAKGEVWTGSAAPTCPASAALHTLGFSMSNKVFAKTKVCVSGLKHYKVFVDGVETSNEKDYTPAEHKVVIKYLTEAGEKMDDLKVEVSNPLFSVHDSQSSERTYTIYDVLLGERYADVSLSPNGKYLIFAKSKTGDGGQLSYSWYVKDLSSGKVLTETRDRIEWMPRTNRYYFVRERNDKVSGTNVVSSRELVTVDPATNKVSVLADNLPEGQLTMAPTENYLIVTTMQEGPKEDPNVYEVVNPEDRQPGWRDRAGLARLDLKSGVCQPLTFGYNNVYLCDISQDGKYLLVMKTESRLTQRPTAVNSMYRMNLETMAMDTIYEKDGFVAGGIFTADGKGIVLQGSPECLGGMGNVVKDGKTPSMIDNQLYLFDVASKRITPLTRDFNPNVLGIKLSPSDGMVYFTAEDRDCVHLYGLNPKSGGIEQVKEPEEVVSKFAIANGTGALAMYGQGASNSDRLYTINVKGRKCVMVDDLSAQRLAGIRLGECKPWTYVNAQGDSICCRYYLPADFDASKKYPMIVNYYGGCSPTERVFESRYPHHAYAALGYVVLVVNPHGATGFGQDWSAAHVNTAGKGPAEDIIESTKAFCKEHSWVNDKKIGCIGASYGGFMTQYLQTVTDIFAAAISHAGISDHTSYWGYGYWGYSYSETSMANSYPWTRKDLFVDQSPLYNADKVHTPLLFVHGDADTNVPVNESIQMYTALKLLGRETAMVLVKGQNHHILDYGKRIKWQNTIWAWFAKWLQDDPAWWESMYPEKEL